MLDRRLGVPCARQARDSNGPVPYVASIAFRMALDHLAGNRFSSFHELNGQYIGTGKYVIEKIDDLNIRLNPNPFAEGANDLTPQLLSTVLGSDLSKNFSEEHLDVLAYGIGSWTPLNSLTDPRLEVIAGQEALHDVVELNSTSKSIFHNKRLRLAAQYILTTALRDNPQYLGSSELVTIDPQIYLPLQAGRLPESEANSVVESGRGYVDELIRESKTHPLIGFTLENRKWVFSAFQNAGITLSALCKTIPQSEVTALHYSKSDRDFLGNSFSVANGDPDGIYHALGKNGAIRSPLTYQPLVGELLESGRKLIGQENLDSHYKKVSSAVLSEVPLIHLGFSKAVAIFRKDRIKLSRPDLRRNEGHLDVFRLIED